jgi:hypothetical protein
MKSYRALALFTAAILLVFGEASRASFIFTDCGGNARLGAGATSGYLGKGSTAADIGNDHASRNVLTTAHSFFAEAQHTETAAFTSRDAMSAIHARSTFTFGKPVGSLVLDMLQFHVWGRASSADSRNHAHNEAAARATATDVMNFNTDVADVADGALVGKLHLGALRSLVRFETLLKIDVLKDGEVIRTENAGSKALTMSLFNGSHYQLRLSYGLTVPPGIDPTFAANWRVTLEPAGLGKPKPVPEPAAFAMLLPAAAVLLRRKARHHAT